MNVNRIIIIIKPSALKSRDLQNSQITKLHNSSIYISKLSTTSKAHLYKLLHINHIHTSAKLTQMAKKTSLGRQKIEIAKIKKKNHLQVTFSKRRSGLFKKASELCTLCGVEIAVIVFSPAGKAFSFGHPNVESIIHKFISQSNDAVLTETQRSSTMKELNNQLTQVTNELELEKKKGEALADLRRGGGSQFWWEAPAEEMGLFELEQLMVCLFELKKSVAVAIGLQAESVIGFSSDVAVIGDESTSSMTFGYAYGTGFF